MVPAVKTKTPSDVFASASTVASGYWMKKPPEVPDLMPVTMPDVMMLWPAKGEVLPFP